MKNLKRISILFLIIALFGACQEPEEKQINLISNSLDYIGSPADAKDRSFLSFSDQGAWFSYAFPNKTDDYGGFSGPFLMTQENGVWSSPVLSQLELRNTQSHALIDWSTFDVSRIAYASHLEQIFQNEELKIIQKLFFVSGKTALITTQISNISDMSIALELSWKGSTTLESLNFEKQKNGVFISSSQSDAIGMIQVPEASIKTFELWPHAYTFQLNDLVLKTGQSQEFTISHSFVFPEYDLNELNYDSKAQSSNSEKIFQSRIAEKETQFNHLKANLDSLWQAPVYQELLAKSLLTLQNNWRMPAGALKHSGIFPSYHYEWFHGFWAWDSWKHAAALAQYNPNLAKEQIRAMYDYMDEKGFIADCIYRDTTFENHNLRNTKPPLSAWAVWKVYEQDLDPRFLTELYPKLVKQHEWWYVNRDHDHDGLCEYGSTDGTLIAAKWESGMDNAVRFDDSKILKNTETAYSLDQESVDLNAYLYAEKLYLSKIAKVLKRGEEGIDFNIKANLLRSKIQTQFFDEKTAWFYDTSIDGKTFIKAMGCEGWIPLWAGLATAEQAEAIKDNMMNPELFNTKVPFQTLSASHPKFKPDGGYWRGPNWLDQAYFGVMGLKNYGYYQEANEAIYKLIHQAEGVIEKGKSIRENYNPITGEGLESENFSWSAAHYLLLITKD